MLLLLFHVIAAKLVPAKAGNAIPQFCFLSGSLCFYRIGHNKNFCDRCGESTITNCQNCNASIRGYYHQSNGRAPIYPTDLPLPSFCLECGKPYPWTEAKLKAAKELSDILEDLSPKERDLLKKSIDDIVRDTPRTAVAANQFKILVAKAGRIIGEQLRNLVVDIASETAKKIILEGK